MLKIRYIVLLFLIFVGSSFAVNYAMRWSHDRSLYTSWSNYYSSAGLAGGYYYMFHVYETGWQEFPDNRWYNQVLLEKPDGTSIHTFNDLTPYDTVQQAWQAGESSWVTGLAEGTTIRMYMHKTAYPDHLSGHVRCDIYQFPTPLPEVHNYGMSSWASPAKIIAGTQDWADIWVQLYRDGAVYDGEYGSEGTEYIQVTTDKGSFSEYDDEKETWMFYSGFSGSTVQLYPDGTPGIAHLTLQWHAHRENPIIQHLNVAMGDYFLTVQASPDEIPADAESSSQISVQVNPYNVAMGNTVSLTADHGTFAATGNSTVDILLDGSGLGTTTFISPDDPGYCAIKGIFGDAEDTERILAKGKSLKLEVSPTLLPADSTMQSEVEVTLRDEYFYEIYGEPVTLTTTLGSFENGSRTMIVSSGSGPVLFRPEDEQPGVATIEAIYSDSSDTLSDSKSVDIFVAKLIVQCDPEEIEADGESESTVIVTLFLDGKPATSGGTIYLNTSHGSLTDGMTTGSDLALPIAGTGTVTATLIASDNAGTATITAEYLPENLTDTATVEMKEYELTFIADLGLDYSSMPGQDASDPYHQDDVPAQATLFGLTKIPVRVVLTGPEPLNKTVRLVSGAAGFVNGGGTSSSINFPEYVYLDSSGNGQFILQVRDMFEFNSEYPEAAYLEIGVSGRLTDKSYVGADISVPLVDNYRFLIDMIYETQIKPGLVMTHQDDLNIGLQALVDTGVYAGLITDLLAHSYAEYNPYTCGGYQLQILHLFDDLRINDERKWLLNGLDYGPIVQCDVEIPFVGNPKGLHQAVVLWPSSKYYYDADYARVLDPWIYQDPVDSSYTWSEWSAAIGVSLPFLGLAMEVTANSGSSNEFADSHYPNTGGDYPDEPYWPWNESDPEVAPFAKSIIIDCPVKAFIEDRSGNRGGYLPPQGSDPPNIVHEIPNSGVWTLKAPDNEIAWSFDLPQDADVTLEMTGYANGEFTIYLIDTTEPMQVRKFSHVELLEDQAATAFFDPNSLLLPAILLETGAVIIPDSSITLDAWTFSQGVSSTTLSLINETTAAVYGPIQLAIEVTTPGVSLLNPDGFTPETLPYIEFEADLSAGTLPGFTSHVRVLEFDNPQQIPFDLTVRLAGFADSSHLDSVSAQNEFEASGLAVCGDANYALQQGDLDKDCDFDLNDLGLFAPYWLLDDCENMHGCDRRDADGDHLIQMNDLVPILESWLQSYGPVD